MSGKTQTNIQISLAVLMLISGLSTIGFTVWAILVWFDSINDYVASIGGTVNYYFFVKQFHLAFLVGIISIIGAFLLFLNRKTGWILSASVSIYHAVFYSVNITLLFFEKPGHDSILDNFFIYILTIWTVLAILFLLGSIFLLLPNVRTQFHIYKKEYWISIGLLMLLSLDRFVF